MKDLYQKNKTLFFTLLLISFLVFIVVLLKIQNNKKQSLKKEEKKLEVLPQSELIPTIDSSVIVDLKSLDKKEVTLTLENLPLGTTMVEYELSYLAQGGLLKGKIGNIEVKDEKKIQRKITLGTCSAGTCVYDQGVEKIEVSLKFTGSYGEKIFKREYNI